MNRIRHAVCMSVAGVLFTATMGCQRDEVTSHTVSSHTISSQAVASVVSACERAARDAAASIAAENLILKQYPPLPSPPGHGEYTQLLRERCNVVYEVIREVPQGVSENDFSEEVKCWNEVMNAEIRVKHGEAIFTELHELARQRWRAKIDTRDKQ